MKWIKRIFVSIVIVMLVAVGTLFITGNEHVLYGVGKTYLKGKTAPDIDDMPYFSTRAIPADRPQPWPVNLIKNTESAIPDELMHKMDSMETTAFLVISRDTIVFEQYFRGFSDTTHSNSFSVAKSFLSILVGVAIDEGYIESLDQPVGDFIPEFREGVNASLTVRHLLQMTSGIPFGESYQDPFGYMAKAYYGKDLVAETMKFKVEKEPGTQWVYEGGNTVLLGLILERATGRTVSQFFFEKVWSCVGAESTAYWNLDKKDGMEKTYSGFYSTARDFARIGKLYKNEGRWGADTLVSPDFARLSVTPNGIPDVKGEACKWYGLHWWIGEYQGMRLFSCRGLRGQYIIVIPERDLVVVRLGHQQVKERRNHMPVDMDWYIEAALRIAQ